jgi:hypothetical protein
MTTPVRRMKTYTGATGYVYQYYFVGRRDAVPGDPAAPATEFIFDVTADRKLMFAASIFLKPEAAAAWAGTHGRALSETEQYGAAKMRLFQGFDEIENFLDQGRRLVIDAGNIEQLLEPLNLE